MDELEKGDTPRRNKRARVEKLFEPEFSTYLLENEPQSYSQVVQCPDGPFWKEAIKSEVDSSMRNHTW